MNPIRVIVCGASGRVGSAVAGLARKDPRFHVSGCLVHERSVEGGTRVEEGELAAAIKNADVAVDFTVPAASVRHAEAAAEARKPIVIGTTGFTDAQFEELRALSARIPMFVSPNMSLAMNVMYELAREAQVKLPDYDALIVEAHHAAKRDAPSGTALKLQTLLGLKSSQVFSLRAGGIVGDHTLVLAGPHERLEITHRAQTRDSFADGALEAAAWLIGKKPKLYHFTDYLADA
jgi:4-hydroxy-tetrahydrodipicolinate reductase